MDLSGINADYGDLLKTATGFSTSEAEKAANAIGKNSTDEELMDACKKFEAYLLEQVFKEMQKTVSFEDEDESSVPGLGSGSNALTDYFKDQAIAEVAASSTEREGIGLAQMLYEAMKRDQ